MSDIIDRLAELEYGSDAQEVSKNVKKYVSDFDDLDNLRSELARRESVEEVSTMEDIYSGGGLNCSVRVIAQVAYEQVSDTEEGNLHIQYKPMEIMGRQLPWEIPTSNHIVYEGNNDTLVYDWNHDESKNEQFDVEDIVGLRSLNLIVEDRYADLESAEEEFRDLKDKREESEFLRGMENAWKLDSMAKELPGPAKAAYDLITSKMA